MAEEMKDQKETQSTKAVAIEPTEFDKLLKKEFKPNNEHARDAIGSAVRTLAEQALSETTLVSDDSVSNSYTEWTTDELAQPDTANARVDGSDSTTNDAKGGARVGNQCQISTKDVQVTTRARDSDTIGRADELSYQVMMRQRELRRDADAIYLQNQASVADDGDTVPGITGGLPAWLETNVIGGAGFVAGGFNTTTGAVDAYTPGASHNLTEDSVRDISEGIYQEGGEATKMLSTPAMIRQFSQYMFDSSARIATLQSDQPGKNEAQTAKGSVNVFVSDFSVLEFVPDRLQQVYEIGRAHV